MMPILRRIRSYWFQVPWCVPLWGAPELAATMKGCFGGASSRDVERLGERLARFCQRTYAVPAGRGRDAILLALRTLGTGQGDEVVVPSYLCYSVIEAVLASGAKPVFADIDDSLHVTVASVAAALSPRTKCVIVPHLFGNTAPVDDIATLLEARGIPLIDDAAQGLGTRRRGQPAGSFGQFGVVCGGPGKPLVSPAGAFLLMNDKALYHRALTFVLPSESWLRVMQRQLSFWFWRRLRRHTLLLRVIADRMFGEREEPDSGWHRLASPDAVLLNAQFDALEQTRQQRRTHAAALVKILHPLGWKVISDFGPDANPLKLIVLLPPTLAAADALPGLGEAGIECQAGYTPCHERADRTQSVPRTAALYRRVLCLPIERPLADPGPLQSLVQEWAKAVGR